MHVLPLTLIIGPVALFSRISRKRIIEFDARISLSPFILKHLDVKKTNLGISIAPF